MKNILILMVLFSSILFASNDGSATSEKQKRIEKQLQKDIEKEKKYATENSTFYIDMNAAEVNPESLDSVPTLEMDELDMDSVYD